MKDLWIDIGANSKEDAEQVVQIGDSATFSLNISHFVMALLHQ